MREEIYKKLTPGANNLPKKFLSITENEWLLIEKYKLQARDERINRLD